MSSDYDIFSFSIYCAVLLRVTHVRNVYLDDSTVACNYLCDREHIRIYKLLMYLIAPLGNMITRSVCYVLITIDGKRSDYSELSEMVAINEL